MTSRQLIFSPTQYIDDSKNIVSFLFLSTGLSLPKSVRENHTVKRNNSSKLCVPTQGKHQRVHKHGG